MAIGIDANGHQYVVSAGGSPVARPPVITGEQTVIIWDESRKIEHFIRQADISTTDPNIGFIVPTPQTPELVEADPAIFQMAAEISAPQRIAPVAYLTPLEVITRLAFGPVFAILGSQAKQVFTTISSTLAFASSGSTNEVQAVQVVSEQDVADYHAVVLEADNADALAHWLKENNYAWPANGNNWIKPYIADKWKITAFKLLKNAANSTAGSLTTRAIRMSFATDKPFFPYSEPGDAEAGKGQAEPSGRSLHVAILSNEKMSGKLADGHSWSGVLQFAGSTTPDRLENAIWSSNWTSGQWLALAKLVGTNDNLPSLPDHLTVFQDDSNPRPGTSDLYFSPGTDTASFRKVETDQTLPARFVTRFGDLASDFFALLVIGAVPALFIYCGYRVAQGKGCIYSIDPYLGYLVIILGLFLGVTYGILLISIPSVIAICYCGFEITIHDNPNPRTPNRVYGCITIFTGIAIFLGLSYVLYSPPVNWF